MSTTAAEDRAGALATLTSLLGTDGFKTTEFRDNLRIYIPRARIFEALKALKDAGFAYLSELGGTDYLGYPGRDPQALRYEVHYVLRNQDANATVVVKVGVPEDDTTLPSAYSLWMGSDWMEREVYDMYGIVFHGHPDLRRILMPDEFVAFPLRKDYPLRGRGERHNFQRIVREQS